ncbi:MAG: hypothetical protein ACOC4I_04530 [Spirochaetota bacterium]
MNLKAIRQHGQLGVFLLDLAMVLLLIVNLTWILFDSLLNFTWFRTFLSTALPGSVTWYLEAIRPHFYRIDLLFIAVFSLEFLARWVAAAHRKTHHRWFFFPFVHWYDIIGLIPLAGFRVLRLFRIVSISLRLQRVGALDMTRWWPIRFLIKYYGVLIQELTDRVTINIISLTQAEVRNGAPVVEHIVDEIIVPRQDYLAEWLSKRIEKTVGRNYESYEARLKRYVNLRLHAAIRQNREVARLNSIPVLGRQVRVVVESTIIDVVNRVVSDTLQDIASDKNRGFVTEFVDLFFESISDREVDEQLADTVVSTVTEALDIVKKHVAIKQWQIRDTAADEEEFRRMLRDEFMRVAGSETS